MNHDSKDLRVRRTIKSIRSAFYDLVLEKDFTEITITELTDLAEINRKTFYLHYSSMDDLIKEVEDETVETILNYVQNETTNLDVAGCVSKFYHYLNECDEVHQKLLCSPHYYFFYEDVTDAVLSSPAFQKFYEKTKYPYIVRSYCVTITFIYRSWLNNGKQIPLDELIDYANRLILDGYNQIIEQ